MTGKRTELGLVLSCFAFLDPWVICHCCGVPGCSPVGLQTRCNELGPKSRKGLRQEKSLLGAGSFWDSDIRVSGPAQSHPCWYLTALEAAVKERLKSLI